MPLPSARFVTACLLGLLWASGLLSCQSDPTRRPAAELAAGQPTRVDTYTVDKSEALPSKDWQIYDLNGDTVCVPVVWRYRVKGATFTAAHPAETDSLVKFTFSRFSRQVLGSEQDAAAKRLLQRYTGFTPVVKKFTFQQGVLYGVDTVVVQHRTSYAAHYLLYVTPSYMYAIDLVMPAESSVRYPKDLSNNILVNIQINSFYIIGSDNKLLEVTTLK
jgi:hypothetical protein